MNDQAEPPSPWLHRLSQFASIAAPTSVAAALLFYFGYVATYARYLYFGVDLTALDLSTTEVVLHGAEALYAPLAGLVVLALAVHLTVRGVRRALARKAWSRTLRVVAIVLVPSGAILFGRGVVGVLWPEVSQTEFPGVTPISLGFGLPLAAIGVWLSRAVRGRERRPGGTVVLACLTLIALLGVFWATNSFAAAYGRGIAETVGTRIAKERPAVVLDTEEPLHLNLPGLQERLLPSAEGHKFRYRYRGLHVLTEAGGKLLLVTAERNGRSGTIVVPYDGSARILFVPS
ncbi:hypothetical protein [Amycolatopsis sp. EV170708-02-1]|uniref:hypothetical protein n=1 Tax=Amycolatopsis sp. EV170708-02-1 TaxID=2919322 RepID=UPI001F0C3553|nr:hypothetical protein [Amycolatopsis sp. EV170708-02-1]UMP03392.1 hypothetical protein MJQ72_00450 [Amycolatopsis sp. EV170708-02-1]